MHRILTRNRTIRFLGLGLASFLIAAPAQAQDDQELNLQGAFDFHVHQAPDSVPRTIDADDLARLAKSKGMRGMIMKNHWEETGSLVYMVRKLVPGIEIYGGVTQDLAVGGMNLEAVKHMVAMKGGYGRVVWLPTYDAENAVKKGRTPNAPFVAVSKDGKLVPSVLELMDFIKAHPQMVLETGHISAEEVLMVTHEAHERGLPHVVVTHAMFNPVSMNVDQMKQAARDGAYLEFVYNATFGNRPGTNSVDDYAKAIRAVGPEHCIVATDYGNVTDPPRGFEPDALLAFMQGLHKGGLTVAEINQMVKDNPLLALGLKP